MTPNKEDYLKMIYELGGTTKKVTNKELVAGLKVSAASVSEMVTKLLKGGFVEHVPYQGIQLTQQGLQKASALVRKHRLWEVFLVSHLGYAWNEVHEEAEVLEHVTSVELARKLDQYLNFPTVCPHGGMIPTEKGIIDEKILPNLVDKQVYDVIKIKRVADEKELLDYLASLEVNIGDVYKIMDIGAYEGPIILESEGKQLAISYKAAMNIFIEIA
ncbi:metal-dependent transcriptional regulator [Carnobacterium viridans]|uniref:Manganese transport regulator n=1 Tax=Carnobacterium viridans TaxID=174587 RepID=A0A1H1BDP6_9LACT|nr:metal-dependent transcriptional regulator [Carnobacterium viridans]UDE95846.1 metal-dependent transcriptional regulator [Carnobacterium viridans]SDQ49526.1 iron (metal) dependent repressor, DtxR family [Carnobacterium viridans]